MHKLIYFFLLITFALPAMAQEKPDPSKNTDGTCWLARVPTAVLNEVLMPLVLEETDEEFVARARRNYPIYNMIRNARLLESSHGTIVTTKTGQAACLTLIDKQNHEHTILHSQEPQTAHHKLSLSLVPDHSKVLFVHTYIAGWDGQGGSSNYFIGSYDLHKKIQLFYEEHGPGLHQNFALTSSHNFCADLHDSCGARCMKLRNLSTCFYCGIFQTELPNPDYISLDRQEKKLIVLNEKGEYDLYTISGWWLENPRNIQTAIKIATMQKYLRQKRVCKNLQSSLKSSKSSLPPPLFPGSLIVETYSPIH